MTTIQYGGGPTLEQRRAFCGLKPGSHIPGYQGFTPQLKTKEGKRYAQATHEIAQELPYYSGPKAGTNFEPVIREPKGVHGNLFEDEVPGRKIPKSTGDNKYIENMIPGYSGDVPRWNYKFGATYKNICDECVDEFITNYEKNQNKMVDLQKMSTMFPKLRSISGDPRVRDHLNLWTDAKMRRSVMLEDHRGPTEPPIPGYKGFVPRVYSTELGLGCRYNQMTKNSLEVFQDELRNRQNILKQPLETTDNKYRVVGSKPISLAPPTQPAINRRLYPNEGLIPNYTGFVPKNRFIFGDTYGNATRSLEACKHPYPNFGEYIRSGRALAN